MVEPLTGALIAIAGAAAWTTVKVKDKSIEFQLGGGGFGTFWDASDTSVHFTPAEKSQREKDLEDQISNTDDSYEKARLQRQLDDLRREGVITTQKLVADHHVVMDPAYVHITQASLAEHARLARVLRANGVYSIGRYGAWTYCSIEDNIVEGRGLAQDFDAAG